MFSHSLSGGFVVRKVCAEQCNLSVATATPTSGSDRDSDINPPLIILLILSDLFTVRK